MRVLLRRPRSTCSPRCATSASPRAPCPRRSARRREPRAADVGRHRARAAGARRRGSARGSRRPRVAMRSPRQPHRLWQVAVDAALIALAWIAAWYVRFDARPRYYDRYLEWDVVLLVVGDHAPGLRRLRLLQPLVALRVDAGHVGRPARRGYRGRRGVPRLRVARLPPRRCRAASGSSTCCSSSRS